MAATAFFLEPDNQMGIMTVKTVLGTIVLAAALVLAVPCFGNAAASKDASGKPAPAASAAPASASAGSASGGKGAPATADPAPSGDKPQAQAGQEEENILRGLKPLTGPVVAKLGTQGEVKIPAGLVFFNAKDTRTLLERMENITNGDELGLVAPADLRWIAVFDFEDTGYVEDTGDAADIDGKALL